MSSALAAMVVIAGCSLGGGPTDESPSQEPTQAETPSGSSGEAERPAGSGDAEPVAIGEGDPMLGVTTGLDRGDVREIPAEELERTSAIETAEAFRRAYEGESKDASVRVQSMQAVADPTLAAQLPLIDDALPSNIASDVLDVSEEYETGDKEPYAGVTAYSSEGDPLYTVRLSIKVEEADPSIGTWSVISVDWHGEASDDAVLPLSQAQRLELREGAAAAAIPVVQQVVGESPGDRDEALKSVLSDPVHAIERGRPRPDQNVRISHLDTEYAYFVSKPGSSSIWVKASLRSAPVAQSGRAGDPVTTVVYVELTSNDGVFSPRDVLSEEEYTAATA